jgi:hypothetical protein
VLAGEQVHAQHPSPTEHTKREVPLPAFAVDRLKRHEAEQRRPTGT